MRNFFVPQTAQKDVAASRPFSSRHLLDPVGAGLGTALEAVHKQWHAITSRFCEFQGDCSANGEECACAWGRTSLFCRLHAAAPIPQDPAMPQVGMAQDPAAAGTELPALMTAGRWASPAMLARYTGGQDVGRGAAAQYYGHHGR